MRLFRRKQQTRKEAATGQGAVVRRRPMLCPMEVKLLALEALQTGLTKAEVAVFFAPAVVGVLADLELAADLADGDTAPQLDIGLTQLGDDLLGRVAFLLSRRCSSRFRIPRLALDRVEGGMSPGCQRIDYFGLTL